MREYICWVLFATNASGNLDRATRDLGFLGSTQSMTPLAAPWIINKGHTGRDWLVGKLAAKVWRSRPADEVFGLCNQSCGHKCAFLMIYRSYSQDKPSFLYRIGYCVIVFVLTRFNDNSSGIYPVISWTTWEMLFTDDCLDSHGQRAGCITKQNACRCSRSIAAPLIGPRSCLLYFGSLT